MSHRETFEEDYKFEVEKTEDGGYSVKLPHQCDEWEILGADIELNKKNDDFTDNYPNLPKNKEIAVKQMELFIQRGQEVLKKLKEL